MGVIELESRFRVTSEDMRLLDCFESFASVLLEKGQLQEIADFGKVEVRLQQWVADEERTASSITEKLRIPPKTTETLRWN
jgi:hypothetical protein